MSIVEYKGGPITHRYLMNKSKDELATMVMRTLRDRPLAVWLPIESAPRDESVILLGLPKVGALKDEDARRVYEGRWNKIQSTFTSVNGFILLSVATHWMPLPEAPKETPQCPR